LLKINTIHFIKGFKIEIVFQEWVANE
jgi:hypothetical protein